MDDDDKTYEESAIEAWNDKHDDEFIRFERIPEAERLHPSRYLCGLMKLAELTGKPEAWGFAGATHDEVWLEGPEAEDITEEQFVYLLRCGVRYSAEYDRWAMFT
jgi:hypothetical protein